MLLLICGRRIKKSIFDTILRMKRIILWLSELQPHPNNPLYSVPMHCALRPRCRDSRRSVHAYQEGGGCPQAPWAQPPWQGLQVPSHPYRVSYPPPGSLLPHQSQTPGELEIPELFGLCAGGLSRCSVLDGGFSEDVVHCTPPRMDRLFVLLTVSVLVWNVARCLELLYPSPPSCQAWSI